MRTTLVFLTLLLTGAPATQPPTPNISAPRPGSPEEKRLPPVQLFDLQDDPRERTNLQARHPDMVERLTALLEEYRTSGRSR